MSESDEVQENLPEPSFQEAEDSNSFVNEESSEAVDYVEENQSQDQVDEYSDDNDDSIEVHDDPIYENDNEVSLSAADENEESEEANFNSLDQDESMMSEPYVQEQVNSLHSDAEPNSVSEEDNAADVSMNENGDDVDELYEDQNENVNNVEDVQCESLGDIEDANSLNVGDMEDTQSESTNDVKDPNSEDIDDEQNEVVDDAVEVQAEDIDDAEDAQSEDVGDVEEIQCEEVGVVQAEDVEDNFEEERHEIELDEPTEFDSHVIEVDNAEDDQSEDGGDVVEIDGAEDSNLTDQDESQSALQGSVEDESEDTPDNPTNGDGASNESSPQAASSSTAGQNNGGSSGQRQANEDEEEFVDPLLEGAVVDLTEEPDEPSSSAAASDATSSSTQNSSANPLDNDDIVVLLEKKDHKKKKGLLPPVPIFVKVNSNQKEKIITDSVDLMCLIQCSICKKNRREIRGHVRTAHKLEFEAYKQLHGETMHFSRLTYHRCKICSKLIVYEFWNFRNHLRRAHRMDTVRYSLKFLEQKKKQPPQKPQKQSRQRLQQQQQQQVQQQQQQQLAAQPQVFTNVVSEMCKFQCKICMQSFSFLPEHVKNHHSLGFPQYKEMFGNELKLTTVTYHKCNICQKTLRFDRPTLQKHLGVVHKAKLGAYMKHYLVRKAVTNVGGEALPTSPAPAPQNSVKSLGSFKVSSSLTITKVRATEDGTPPARPTASTSHAPSSLPGRSPMYGGRGGGRGGGRYNYVEEPKIFTDNPDEMCLTMCRLCGSELKPKSLSNHLINQHQSNLVRYKAEFGREIMFTKLRYHKCKVCGKTLKFESKQLCYHLTSVHSMSFTQYKEKYLYREGVLMKKRHRGGGKHSFIQRHAAANGGALNPAAAAALWSAGLISAGVEPTVAHVLPDLYTQPPGMGNMGGIGLGSDEDAESNHYVPGYGGEGCDDDMVGPDIGDGEGIDPLQCLSVSIDQNGKNDELGGIVQHEEDTGMDGGYHDGPSQEDVNVERKLKMEVSHDASISHDEPDLQHSEDSILPDLDVDITENPIKIEPETSIDDS